MSVKSHCFVVFVKKHFACLRRPERQIKFNTMASILQHKTNRLTLDPVRFTLQTHSWTAALENIILQYK